MSSHCAFQSEWAQPARHVLDGYSLEMTVKDRAALDEASHRIAPGTPIAVTFLPDEAMDDRIAAAAHIRDLGFVPMPHLSARRITSRDELAVMTERLAREAQVSRLFLVAGDPPHPAGPFEDTLGMIETGIFEQNGISAIGIAGHPEGHPAMTDADLWAWMERKIAVIEQRGMSAMVVTQFGFNPQAFLDWLLDMRLRGVDVPVRIGVPGPAGIKRLLRYAKFCGVGASGAVLRKYGISLTNLMGTAGPGKLVDALHGGLGHQHGQVRLHFYPFGGLQPTVDWIDTHSAKYGAPVSA